MENGENDIRMQYERHTDVMHVDLAEPKPDARVHAIEVGHWVGFKGRVIARVGDDGELFGLTIMEFTSVKRTLHFRYKAFAWKQTLLLVVHAILAGLALGEMRHHCPVPA
ncbi:MAG TPA: hypothetical protein VN579_03790 [Bryobacteraceae bacterium]|nr:hypothetical protein [Bryobacteraceae bacterium]